jgi:hypothetical protein
MRGLEWIALDHLVWLRWDISGNPSYSRQSIWPRRSIVFLVKAKFENRRR